MPGSPSPQQQQQMEWRCTSCRTLLGIARGDVLELRYKTARFVVRGQTTAECRRCGTTNINGDVTGGPASGSADSATASSRRRRTTSS